MSQMFFLSMQVPDVAITDIVDVPMTSDMLTTYIVSVDLLNNVYLQPHQAHTLWRLMVEIV